MELGCRHPSHGSSHVDRMSTMRRHCIETESYIHIDVKPDRRTGGSSDLVFASHSLKDWVKWRARAKQNTEESLFWTSRTYRQVERCQWQSLKTAVNCSLPGRVFTVFSYASRHESKCAKTWLGSLEWSHVDDLARTSTTGTVPSPPPPPPTCIRHGVTWHHTLSPFLDFHLWLSDRIESLQIWLRSRKLTTFIGKQVVLFPSFMDTNGNTPKHSGFHSTNPAVKYRASACACAGTNTGDKVLSHSGLHVYCK